MSIDEIERLMKDGKIAEADAAAKELSEREPGKIHGMQPPGAWTAK